MGSPLYMAPEQVKDARTVDARADIWALGVTTYELLTGEVPFTGHSLGEICAQILMVQPLSPRSRRADVPEQLDAVVMRCLRKEPAERYATVSALVHDLRAVRARAGAERVDADLLVRRTLASTPPAMSADSFQTPPAVGVETSQAVSSTQPQRNKPRAARRLGLPIAASAGVIVIGTGATIGLRSYRAPATKSTDPPSLAESPVPAVTSAQRSTALTAQPASDAASPRDTYATSSPSAAPSQTPAMAGVSHRGGHPVHAPVVQTSAVDQPPATGAIATNPFPQPSAQHKASCDPNFTFDDLGRKHFKPECFTK